MLTNCARRLLLDYIVGILIANICTGESARTVWRMALPGNISMCNQFVKDIYTQLILGAACALFYILF
jgi:hypothetical protein